MRERGTGATLAVLAVMATAGGFATVAEAACNGVRPGAEVITQDLTICTMNFVFRGSDHRMYVGTAGHCVPDPANAGESLPGEHTWPKGTGPVATDSQGNAIGHYAFAILKGPRDISLIRLFRGVTPIPAMCRWGGPTGINTDITNQQVQLHFYGNGELLGALTPARDLRASGMPDPNEVYADGAISPGDSGSGVISADGRAVGVLVTLGVHLGPAGFGVAGITRLPPQLPIAEKALGTKLRLVKAPLAG
jgi:hypothetical protein